MTDRTDDDISDEEEEEGENVKKEFLQKSIRRVGTEFGELSSPFPDITKTDFDRFLFLEASMSSNIRDTLVLKDEVEEEEESDESEIEKQIMSHTRGREEHMAELLVQKWMNNGFLELCIDPKFLDSIKDSRRISDEVTINLKDLSGHKTGFQYVCPRIEVEKFNPKTKLIKHRRLWEINLIDREFLNLKQSDYSYKSTFSFPMLTWVNMEPEENVVVIRLRNMMNKKPRKLKCESRIAMWRLYELIKFSMHENPTWIPDFQKSPSEDSLRRVTLCGDVNYQINRDGKMVIEKKVLKGTNFLVGNQFERMSVYCVTWNLKNGVFPKKTTQLNNDVLSKLIRPGAHLYAICLQGMKRKMGYYEGIFTEFFKKEFDFVIVKGCRGRGVGMYLFIDKKYCRKISRIRWSIKTFPRNVSVSDSVYIQFTLNESPVAFVGVHLPDYPRHKSQVIQEIFSKQSLVQSDHYVFFMGDLGYTISLPPILAKSYAKGGRSLFDFDEFLIHRMQSGLLHEFREGAILFPPNEPIQAAKGRGKGWSFSLKKNLPLAYSSRILVKSFQGMESHILAYKPIRSLHKFSYSSPVYGVFTLACQRTHVSHFSKPTQTKEIKVVEMYVGRNVGSDLKNPQIVLEGDWLEPSPIVSSKLKKSVWVSRTPRFPGSCFPILHPVKSSIEFLSSVFLKISVRDDTKEVRGRGVVNIGMTRKNGGWFSIPMCKGSKRVFQLSGVIKVSGEEDEFSRF